MIMTNKVESSRLNPLGNFSVSNSNIAQLSSTPNNLDSNPEGNLNSDLTAELKAGTLELEKVGRRMTSQALGWKLMTELEKNGIGTLAVESNARKRKAEREMKQGNIRTNLEPRIMSLGEQRDEEHVRAQMRQRKKESMEDWKSFNE